MVMFNRLPYFVRLQGIKYIINVDFRDMISFENKLQDRSVDNSKKIEYGLRHFYPAFFYEENYLKLLQQPKLYKKACEKLIWFYKCGKEMQENNSINYEESTQEKTKQIYSYEFDDEYIFSAFLEQYGIDLNEIEYMHWWKFKALFNSLNENNVDIEK